MHSIDSHDSNLVNANLTNSSDLGRYVEVSSRYVEVSTPLVVGQSQRLLPFSLRLRDATVVDGELLSLRSMEGGVSLLICRDGANLQRLSIPAADLQHIEVRGAEPAPVVAMPAPTWARDSHDARWLSDPAGLGAYLDAWLSDPETARAQLPELDLAELSTLLGSDELANETTASARRFGLPIVSPEILQADASALAALTPVMARRLLALPLLSRAGVLAVAVADPALDGLQNQLEFASGLRVATLVCAPSRIEQAIARHYDRLEDREMLQALGMLGGHEREGSDATREMERLSAERPIVRLVHDLMEAAVRKRASDIHIRPGASAVEVLYRIDGLLHVMRTMDKALLAAVVSRIKVLGGMNIAERRLPQDGRASFALKDRVIDMRISILPTVDGESAVIRLLDTTQSLRNIDSLGLSAPDALRLRDLLARSHGMVLVTGPTGSGKSTTLYAALNHVRSEAIRLNSTFPGSCRYKSTSPLVSPLHGPCAIFCVTIQMS